MKIKASDYLVKDPVTGKYKEDAEQAVRDDVEKHHWLNVGRTVLKDWRLYLMLVPMLLVFLFWRYFPMYELLGAFKLADVAKSVSEQYYTGFYYFKMLFTGPNIAAEFWRAFRNTFLLSFYGLLFGFPTPIIIALFFNEIKSNVLRSVYQVITYLPKFISTVVMTSLITMLVRQPSTVIGIEMGVISQMLVGLGLISEEVGAAGLLFLLIFAAGTQNLFLRLNQGLTLLGFRALDGFVDNAAGFFFRAGNFLFRNLFPVADTEREANDSSYHHCDQNRNDMDEFKTHLLPPVLCSFKYDMVYRYGDFGRKCERYPLLSFDNNPLHIILCLPHLCQEKTASAPRV